MRFIGTCFRAHDPRWSFAPLSGAGAAQKGGRFNPVGCAALYLSLDLNTAILEASQGFSFKVPPLTLVSYTIDCENIHDLTDPAALETLAVEAAALSAGWALAVAEGRRPRSWDVATHLIEAGSAGIIVPSFAPGASTANRNLVLWRWAAFLPHKVEAFDPSGRLPKNQLSWP